jgi:hypothetical protein
MPAFQGKEHEADQEKVVPVQPCFPLKAQTMFHPKHISQQKENEKKEISIV